MVEIKWVLGVDISTQTVTAMLAGVQEENGEPRELVISSAWIARRPCASETERKTPTVWLRRLRECVSDLKRAARQTELVESIGISTTFPGAFTILKDGSIDPALVSLYDNTDDAGINDEVFGELLGRAESHSLSRMWPGNMTLGVAHLVASEGLKLDDAAAIVPPNTAFAYALRQSLGEAPDPSGLFSDFTQTAISGMYDARTGEAAPGAVLELLEAALPRHNWPALKSLLPGAQPAWRNVLDGRGAVEARSLLGLPNLKAVSIGAGDSPLGTLTLLPDADTIVNVRGSSDSPILTVDAPRPRMTQRETVLHHPLPSATSLGDAPWSVVAPMLRSGKVWDWVRRLRYADNDDAADAELEWLATDALKKRLRAPAGSLERSPMRFAPALGGERAPDWDPRATGVISGLIESHGIGDIALAALEGMSRVLSECIRSMELRYDTRPRRLVVAGGPAKNALWNWVMQVFTGKQTFATTFSDASLLGAALIGRAAGLDGELPDRAIREKLLALARRASEHSSVKPAPVGPPDEELAELEEAYSSEV